MRIFFTCVGSSLQIFHRLAAELAALTPLESVSYSVSDRHYIERYLAQHGPLTETGEVIREWNLVIRGRARRVTPEELAAWEARLGIPSLWPAIVSDRRTYHGRLVKVRQDYAPYLTLAEMQGIMVETLETYWGLFERQRPDVVIGFTAAFFEVIPIFWVARAHGIPYLNMRSTKIANYVRLTSDPLERSDPHLEAHLARLGKRPDPALSEVAKAREFLEKARSKRVTYEGGLVRQKRRGLAAEFLRYALYALPLLGRDLWDALRRLPFDTHRYPAHATWREQTVGRAWRIL
ncbi:MAG: hypothetical protein EPO32_05140 [Anaerolineae bacterium]|nr:MAG: hypothetical protein EPO32_05140 [Anaerolineae bacterium]